MLTEMDKTLARFAATILTLEAENNRLRDELAAAAADRRQEPGTNHGPLPDDEISF